MDYKRLGGLMLSDLVTFRPLSSKVMAVFEGMHENAPVYDFSDCRNEAIRYASECFVEAILPIQPPMGVENYVVPEDEADGLSDFLVVLRHVDAVSISGVVSYKTGDTRLLLYCTGPKDLATLVSKTGEHPCTYALGADESYTHSPPTVQFDIYLGRVPASKRPSPTTKTVAVHVAKDSPEYRAYLEGARQLAIAAGLDDIDPTLIRVTRE